MSRYFTNIWETHRLVYCIMSGGRKVIIILPSSRAKKVTPSIICLITYQTVPPEVIYPKT